VHTNAYASGTLLATYNGASTFFDLTDWLGTKRVEVAAGGGCASAFVSLPFGNTANDNSSYTPTALPGYSACGDATEQHFTGKERDAESGNDYFGARYYASTMGRFLSPDPKAASGHPSDPQTWNRYSYGANNPLTFVDPDGKEPLPSSWQQFFNAFYRSDFSRVNVQPGWLGNHVTPGGADAMTIGRVVFLSASFAKEYADRTQNAIIVTGHELSHVEDYSSEGITNFLLQYAGAYLYNRSQGQDDYDAYRNIPTEFIASLNEGDIAAFLKGHGSILQKLENNQTLSPEDIAKILLWELQQYQQQQQQQPDPKNPTDPAPQQQPQQQQPQSSPSSGVCSAEYPHC
jgi:RHS repeat-associated protein